MFKFGNPAIAFVNHLQDDDLLDMIVRMGARPRIYLPQTIRYAYAQAVRRGLLTRSEADAGVAICVKIKR